jgi:hypothetical protein
MIKVDRNGYLIYQWVCNTNEDRTKHVDREWAKLKVTPTGDEVVQYIKRSVSQLKGLVPYTCNHTNTGTTLAQVLYTGVQLVKRRIPQDILQSFSDSKKINWVLPA